MQIEALETGYQPGVCNIGKEERAMRLRVGFLGLLLTLALAVPLLVLRVDWPWRLTVFLPAVMAASGLVQGFYQFCVGFAAAGVFNFGPKVGTTTAVPDPEALKRDRAKMLQLNLIILASALAVTALVVLLP